jgi:hypothetical protein
MLDSSDGWAVGDSGTILRYQGGLWVTYASSTASQLNAIYLADSAHGWAVGAGGVILHFDGSVWLSVADQVSANLNSVTQVNSQQAWAVGDSGRILQWNGFGWYQFTPTPPLSGTPDLNSIFILPNGFGFIVGSPEAPGGQATVLQVPSMAPIPETDVPQVLLLATFALILIATPRLRKSKRGT